MTIRKFNIILLRIKTLANNYAIRFGNYQARQQLNFLPKNFVLMNFSRNIRLLRPLEVIKVKAQLKLKSKLKRRLAIMVLKLRQSLFQWICLLLVQL